MWGYAMAAVTNYIILPFVLDKRGKLKAGTAQKAKDPTKAVLAAERMAGQYAGIVVLEEQCDPEQDIFAEPRLICVIGRVPEEMIEQLAA
jgi:hypothetical protein